MQQGNPMIEFSHYYEIRRLLYQVMSEPNDEQMMEHTEEAEENEQISGEEQDGDPKAREMVLALECFALMSKMLKKLSIDEEIVKWEDIISEWDKLREEGPPSEE